MRECNGVRSNRPITSNRSIAGEPSVRPHFEEGIAQVRRRQRSEAKDHDVAAGAHTHAAKQDIGAQDARRLAVDLGDPARIIELVRDQGAGFTACDLGRDAIEAP